jgi:carbonic anhydrase
MQRLVDGIHEFQQEYFPRKRRLFEDLTAGQEPTALFITCSDSRINPSLLTQTGPGELFILRNAGNLVPAYNGTGGEAATIEFALCELKVKEVIVCGHSHCGAMKGLLSPERNPKTPAINSWLQHAESTKRIIEENYTHLEDNSARVSAAVAENVLVQLEHLRTHPCVAAALTRGELALYGWVYKFETGEVFAYDPAESQFLPVTNSNPRPPRKRAPAQVI